MMEQSILFVNNTDTSRDKGAVEIKPFSVGNSSTERHPALTMVAVVARNGAIGRDGDLLWHIPADLRHFKRVTSGGAVIMGRKTWETLPRRPLPGRLNIVVTRQAGYEAPGAQTAASVEEAIVAAKDSQAFIIGGGEIYRIAMPYASRLILTEVDADVTDADTWFPPVDSQVWIREHEDMPAPEDIPDGVAGFKFVTYKLR